jgi:hypothetical protein
MQTSKVGTSFGSVYQSIGIPGGQVETQPPAAVGMGGISQLHPNGK